VKRRSLLLATGAASLGGALAVRPAWGQPTKEPRRVGVLQTAPAAIGAKATQALRDGLRERGHVEGRDIVIDVRYAEGRPEEFPRLAAELAALKPAVIVASGQAATAAALAAAPEVPIVSLHGDFVAAGLAVEIGRPGGRVTGVSMLGTPLDAKRLELLAELLPKGSAVLNLADPRQGTHHIQSVEAAGRPLGLVMHAAYARTPTEIDTALATARRLRVAGVNVLASPFLNARSAQIIELAAGAKLPAIYHWRESAEAGGLMTYGPSLPAMFRQLASFVSRILNGAKPGELPIEQATRFELVINVKTARALGLTIPQSLLLRADEVIR